MYKYPHTSNYDSDLYFLVEKYEELKNTYDDTKKIAEELKLFVNNYFDNLDVQNEINAKIDELVANGTMTDLINDIVEPIATEQSQDIAVLKARMDTFTSLTDGSTTGDAELQDIRVAYNGETYATAGDSVRGQVSGVVDNIDYITKQSTINLINPLTCKNNTSLSSQNGSEQNNSNYWISDYIPVEKDKTYIFTRLNNNMVDFTPYKTCLYDSSRNFIQATTVQNISTYLTTDTGYVKLQENINTTSFSNRDKVCFAEMTGVTKPFAYPLNIGNVTNIGIDNLSVKLGNMNFLPNLDFILGSVSSQDGHSLNVSNRIVNRGYINLPIGTQISMKDNYFNVFEFSEDFTTFTSSYWIKDYVATSKNNMYRIVVRYNDNRNIDDISDLLNQLIIKLPVEQLLDTNIIGSNGSYYGEKIELENKITFTEVMNLSTGINGNSIQGGTIIDDKLLQFYNTGYCNVYDLTTKSLLYNFKIGGDLDPHCNMVVQGNKYNSDDTYPTLYLNAYNNSPLPKGCCYVHRLNDELNGTTLVQTIQIAFTDDILWTNNQPNERDYGNFVVDTKNELLYAYVSIDSLNITRVFKFNLPSFDSSSVTLNINDIVDYFDVNHIRTIQDNTLINNKIFVLNGNGLDAGINVIDIIKKQTVSYVSLYGNGYNIEPESVGYYNGRLMLGSTKLWSIKF